MDVKLSTYSGPLDLLLKLITKNEIDIHDIPISELTAQYLQAITHLPPDMEQLSEFLVMAATLLEIKSRMLLPRPKIDSEEDSADPRETLVQQLLAYSQAQAIAQELLGLTPIGEKFTHMGDRLLLESLRKDTRTTLTLDFTLSHLSKIFAEVMSRKESRTDTIRAGYGEMPRDKFTVTEKVAHMSDALKTQGRLHLFTLFHDCRSKNEMVVTFLALLEMVRRGLIHAAQSTAFGDVEVLPCPV